MTVLLNGAVPPSKGLIPTSSGRTSKHSPGALARAPTDAISLAGVHVLIIDDDPTQAESLGDLLSLLTSVRCTIVTSAEQALAALDVGHLDVAIVDLLMPDMDGLELLRRLRERLPALPAILVTGWPPSDRRVAIFLEESGTAYLVKPIDPSALCDQIASLVGPTRRAPPGRT